MTNEEGTTMEQNPDPIEDAPAICLTCSALGTLPHLCDDPGVCPCGSDQCGLPPTPPDATT